MPTYSFGFSVFGVPDLEAARQFYGDKLGLEVRDEDMGQLSLTLPGGAWVLLYPKSDYVPATSTTLSLVVDNIDAAVDELAARGIEFERYEGFEQDDRGIARGIESGQGPDIAWCTDPFGTIIAVMQNPE